MKKFENCILKACLAQKLLDNDKSSMKHAGSDVSIFESGFLFTKVMFSSLLRADLMMYYHKICYPEFKRGALKDLVDNFTIQIFNKSLKPPVFIQI